MPGIFDLAFKKQETRGEGKPTPPPPSESELLLRLCRLIIERYRDHIEAEEQKSVLDLQRQVKPFDERIAKIRDSITEGFHPYVYDEHFLSAAKEAFSFVSAFATMHAPVPFWLSFAEMEELMAGEEIDKSILLCSILRSLGSENAKVFVTDNRRSYVLFQFSGKSFVADHSEAAIAEKPSGAEALSHLSGKILYSFSDKEYDDFQEEA